MRIPIFAILAFLLGLAYSVTLPGPQALVAIVLAGLLAASLVKPGRWRARWPIYLAVLGLGLTLTGPRTAALGIMLVAPALVLSVSQWWGALQDELKTQRPTK